MYLNQVWEGGFLFYRLTVLQSVDIIKMVICMKEEKSTQTVREEAYEYGLPQYLQDDLDAYKAALQQGSDMLDCLWGELYGSINAAEITDGVITPKHADYLRKKYL